MNFQRAISTPALLFSAVGAIIGSGWLFGPLYAAQIAGPASIVAWIIGGAIMMLIALTFAELATAFPVAGGMVRFAEFSHGPLLSFTMGWMAWLSSVVVAPVETLSIMQYAANYLPGLIKKVGTSHVLTHTGMVFAALLMLIMCLLNRQGAKFFSKSSSVIVAIKLIVPLLVIFMLFKVDFHLNNFIIAGGFSPYGWQGIFTALPLGGIIFSFIGYSPAITLAEEAKNPQRAIPIAIIGSLIICIVIYCLLQITFIGGVESSTLTNGWHNLAFKGDSGPFAGFFNALGISWLVLIIYADALFSPFGTAYIYTASTARVNYALCKVGFFPNFFRKLNQYGVPSRSIALNYIVGLLLFLPFPSWQNMVNFIIACFLISFSIGPLSLISLRETHPNQPRSFRLPWAKPLALLAFYFCNLLVYWTGWQTVYRLLIAIGIGFAMYFYRQYQWRKKNFHSMETLHPWWLIFYLAGLGIISYLGAYGGVNFIKFGPDFIIVGLFSILFYYSALNYSRTRHSKLQNRKKNSDLKETEPQEYLQNYLN